MHWTEIDAWFRWYMIKVNIAVRKIFYFVKHVYINDESTDG